VTQERDRIAAFNRELTQLQEQQRRVSLLKEQCKKT
jgi:hypothetical protein